jgi:hypothetical protein
LSNRGTEAHSEWVKTHANGFNSGQAYLFTQDNNGAWPLITHPTVSELVAHDQFGTSVALGTAHMLISSKKGTYVLHNKAPEHNIPMPSTIGFFINVNFSSA